MNMDTVQHVDIYESEFGTIQLPPDRRPSLRAIHRFNAEMTRDAFLWGGFESALLHRLDKCLKDSEIDICQQQHLN